MTFKAFGDMFGTMSDAEHGELGHFIKQACNETQQLLALSDVKVEAGLIQEENVRHGDQGANDKYEAY